MSIAENLKEVHEKLNADVKNAGREEGSVSLLCVSKTKPIEMIIEAYNCGERLFGESYAAEAADKIGQLKAQGFNDITWHFIGPIQKNKTRLIAEHFDVAESVDRIVVAKRLNDQRPENLPPLKVLIQVNISDEDQKSGCSYEELDSLIAVVNASERLELKGLMGIGKDTDDKEEIRASFHKLKEKFEALKATQPGLEILSLGMTHDMDIAIAEGSTEVRIGTAIFGAREYKNKESAPA